MTPKLEQGLITIGYLAAGDRHDPRKIGRAVTRFQRHAARTYRMPEPDASSAECFQGSINGICDDATATEIKKWLAEWWHFQYKRDKQRAFLDEMELIGYSEAKLKACGWTSDEMLDHVPG
jgi:hypothetical protein